MKNCNSLKVVLFLGFLIVPLLIQAAEEPSKEPKLKECCGKEETKNSKHVASDCVCPQWRYATYSNYASYYSKLCPGNGDEPFWVSHDSADPNLTEFPGLNCIKGQGCATSSTPSCELVFLLEKDRLHHPNHQVGAALRQGGLPAKLKPDFLPTPVNDARILKDFVAQVHLPHGSRIIFVKLFYFFFDPPGHDTPVQLFGTGVEIKRTEPDIVIHLDIVPVFEDGETTTKCIRFVVNDEHWVPLGTVFQVITKTPVRTGAGS